MAYRFETNQLHAGQTVDRDAHARAVPIYQTTSYVFDDAQQAEDRFALKEPGNIYSRLTNPTVAVLEERIAALEGGVGALATASGAAAITYAILNVARAGDEIVSASTLYGGTYNLFSETFRRLQIGTVFVDPDDPAHFEEAVTDRTKALYVETIGNPNTNLVDLEAVANIAHACGVPLIVDNTFGTPYLIRPIEHGADIVVHSATKFLGGHGTTLGGVIVDSGNFDWTNGTFPEFTQPDDSYHGLVYAKDGGRAAFLLKARAQILRNTGACLSPFSAFLLLQGVETLSLRVERHVQNALAVAKYLKDRPEVTWISYPGLPQSKYYPLAQRYFPKGAGSVFSIGIRGGEGAARKWIDRLRIFSQLANVADAKSLAIHPASTTHQQLSEEQLAAAGVTRDAVRLSIGLENIQDLIEDMDAAFAALR